MFLRLKKYQVVDYYSLNFYKLMSNQLLKQKKYTYFLSYLILTKTLFPVFFLKITLKFEDLKKAKQKDSALCEVFNLINAFFP